MNLKDVFAKATKNRSANGYLVSADNSCTVSLWIDNSTYGQGVRRLTLDFLSRTMILDTTDTKGGLSGIPFSQLDPEVIEAAHALLVEKFKEEAPDLPKPATADFGKPRI